MSFAIEDVILIRASTSTDEFNWEGTDAEIEQFEALITSCEEGTTAEEAIAHNVGLDELTYRIRLSNDIWLDVRTKVVGAKYEPQIGLHGPSLQKDVWEKAKATLDNLYKKAKEESIDNIVFDVYTGLQSYTTTEIPQTNERTSQSPDNHSTADERKGSQSSKVEMLRVIFWTHHLKAPSKKRDMNKWCAELQVYGLVKSGYPGFLCFEGMREDVEEIVRRIKALQWHAITVKTETPYSFEEKNTQDIQSMAIRQCLLAKTHSAKGKSSSDVVRTSMDEVETGGELVQR
ncbi:uncharacterized protein FA14DRAFT_160309 [Meira miltonrushii]|uniref:Small nuclear ribonucleoprotein Prp3 C-terminal domain-containing protein n=1 Tax=Meira miltonrushii TaxID=1280837 RepID=A0A316VCQ0_9BASI|nr:uncharacterized protein FA14DRAFT_160309 [Meira miltonrushii]PWN34898.1 hypothetical protein FA14DRAFT_160309 [Meira miltonrushii]